MYLIISSLSFRLQGYPEHRAMSEANGDRRRKGRRTLPRCRAVQENVVTFDTMQEDIEENDENNEHGTDNDDYVFALRHNIGYTVDTAKKNRRRHHLKKS